MQTSFFNSDAGTEPNSGVRSLQGWGSSRSGISIIQSVRSLLRPIYFTLSDLLSKSGARQKWPCVLSFLVERFTGLEEETSDNGRKAKQTRSFPMLALWLL